MLVEVGAFSHGSEAVSLIEALRGEIRLAHFELDGVDLEPLGETEERLQEQRAQALPLMFWVDGEVGEMQLIGQAPADEVAKQPLGIERNLPIGAEQVEDADPRLDQLGLECGFAPGRASEDAAVKCGDDGDVIQAEMTKGEIGGDGGVSVLVRAEDGLRV